MQLCANLKAFFLRHSSPFSHVEASGFNVTGYDPSSAHRFEG
jgi:hypothetical protein